MKRTNVCCLLVGRVRRECASQRLWSDLLPFGRTALDLSRYNILYVSC